MRMRMQSRPGPVADPQPMAHKPVAEVQPPTAPHLVAMGEPQRFMGSWSEVAQKTARAMQVLVVNSLIIVRVFQVLHPSAK